MMFAMADAGCEAGPNLLAVSTLMDALLARHISPASCAALEHMACGGKRVRARLGLESAKSLGLDTLSATAISAASELIHNASLVHDDIHDRSEVRRGNPTLWARYGKDIAICAGDLMISAAYGAVAQVRSLYLPDVLARMHHRVSEVISGQAADLAAKDEQPITLLRYKEIAAAKSAPLLGLPLELTLILAGRSDCIEQVELAASAFAVAYQMADDIEDSDTDMINGEINILQVLAQCVPDEAAHSVAHALVRESYHLASRLALDLPAGCGGLLATLASTGAQRERDRTVRS